MVLRKAFPTLLSSNFLPPYAKNRNCHKLQLRCYSRAGFSAHTGPRDIVRGTKLVFHADMAPSACPSEFFFWF